MKRTTLNLGPFGVYLWGAILLVGGLAFAGGAALTANTRGTIFPQQLANGPAVPGYVPVAGYCTDTATGTSAGTATANGQCWKPMPSDLPTGTAGQVLGVVALTATRTVVVTGTQTSVGTEAYTYAVTGTGTSTGTLTQNATGTYTYTVTSTSTGIATSGEVSVGTNPRDVCIMGDYAYVANGGAGTVSVVNISNPASPSTSGLPTVTVGSDPRGLACADGWVYVANYGGDSISVIDASTPSSAHVESTYSITAGCGPRALAIRGTHLFMVCNTANTFWKIDASDRGALTQSGTAFSIPSGPIDLTVDDDYYARITCQSGNKVVTVEYSWGGTPFQVGFEDNTAGVYGIYQKPLQFLAVCASTAGKLYLYDTSLSPHLIGSVTTAAGCRHVVIYGSVAITTHYDANKVQVHTIASFGNPSFVEELAISDGPLDIKVSGDYAWVTRYGGAKLQSIYIGKYKQFSGTQTNTNIQTGTTSFTNTLTSAATGTQTVGTTGIYTSSATGTVTGTGAEWKAVNGTLYAGTNIRFTKGTGTDTDTSAAMQDEPKIHLSGLVGTTGWIPVKDATGWGDSYLWNVGTRVTNMYGYHAAGEDTGDTGAGLFMDYLSTGVGRIRSLNFTTSTWKPLRLYGSALDFYVNDTKTFGAPAVAGTTGQVLALSDDYGNTVWTTPSTGVSLSYYTGTMAEVGWQNGSPGTSTSVSRGDHTHACTAATTSSQGCMSYQDKQKLDGLAADAFTVKPYSGAAAGYLQDTIFSYTGSISVGINTTQQKLNLNTKFGTATPASIGTSGSVGTAVDSSRSDHTHGAGAGALMQRYEYTSGSTHTPSGSGSWQKVNQQTFTALGSKFRVSAHARFMASSAAYTYGHLCGLSIMADAGSTASTLRGPKDWIKSEPRTVFYNTTMWPTNPIGGTYIGNGTAEAEFTLSEGTVAVAAAVYQYGNHSSSCTVPSGEMVVYVDVFK